MRPDQRLQRADARLRLEHDAAPPLAGHVQVAHAQRDDDGAHHERPEQEIPVRVVNDHGLGENAGQLVRNLGQQEAHREQDREAEHECPGLAGALEAVFQQAHERAAEQ